ncbi:MAG: hypothetical protein J6Y37_13525 [Paludibacteraceae bacterium]|nr:hypothetical protein [Paludibacteraceae bacterium]
MGLDISVKRIQKKSEDQDSYLSLVDDSGNYENDFPEWTKAFEQDQTESWFDWQKYKEQTGIDLDQCDWHGEEYSKRGCFMTVSPKGVECTDETRIEIDLEKVPTYEKALKVLFYSEVGYQRRGLNGKFYEDYEAGKIGYFVWTKAELERYKQDYCDEPYEYVYPNGEKSGEMVYPTESFQKNIIDNFVEGRDCVTFDW